MITTKQAAAALGITPRRVVALITSGQLRAVKHGRDWMIDQCDLAAVAERKPGWKKGKSRKG